MTKKTTQFKRLLRSGKLEFLMEAHNGLTAKLVEEAGFKGIWASGLTLSASMGVRDSNEASWTQVLEVVELMSDASSIPILLDADTGYGNFNNVRRLVRKLEQRNIPAMCIEDKVFPKTNSFLNEKHQLLADADEFAGLGKGVLEGQRARRVFLGQHVGDGHGVENLRAPQLGVGQEREPVHRRMVSLILDEADFGQHVAELALLHVERDNRLSNAWNIVTKLISGTLRLVSGEEHDVRADPQNASFIHHAHSAMRMRGGGEQNHGQQPRGDSSDHHCLELPYIIFPPPERKRQRGKLLTLV